LLPAGFGVTLGSVTAETPPRQEAMTSMSASLKRVLTTLGSLMILVIAAGAEWRW